MLTSRRMVPLVASLLLVGAFLPAQPALPVLPPPKARAPVPGPPPPDEYGVMVRYLIDGAGNERLRRYFRMLEDLRLAGFKRAADDIPSEVEPEDPKATRVRGVVLRKAVARVLAQPDIQALMLYPQGKALPGKDVPVRVNLKLVGTLPEAQQRDLHAQARLALAGLGFGEAVGYDHEGYTRILGQAPGDKLPVLLEDLRRQSSAWPLLPASLLGDLRKQPGGTELVDRVIDQWTTVESGRKLVLNSLEAWQTSPAAVAYYRTLPASVTSEPIGFQEVQLRHFARHPDSAEVLARLFEEVRKDAAAPEMMNALLTGIEGAGFAANLPVLFRASPPVRLVAVQPDLPLPVLTPAVGAIPKGQEKFTPELRALLANAEEAKKPRRFEIVLANPLPTSERSWVERYTALPVTIEGWVGSIVTVHGAPTGAAQIAALPQVLAVRLPLTASAAHEPERELKTSILRQYADAGRLSQVVLIGSDFRGWEALRGHGLPPATRLLDLTRERNRDLQPDPYPGDPKETGAGTRAARALASMAGTTNLLLVRVDPQAAYQVDYIARITSGEPDTSLNLLARLGDLAADRGELDNRAARLLEDRKRALFDFRPGAEKFQEEYKKRQADFDKDRADFDEREKRFLAHEGLTNDLRKRRVVWNTLTWDEGYPLFDTGTTSRYLDDAPYRGVWLQSRGGDLRRVWYGFWRDADTSGSLDLLPATEPLPAGRWNPDLGFLKLEKSEDLPANAVLRLAVQWKETHDADLALLGVDYYREPLARIAVQVLRQLDPKGAKQPADDLALIAQSVGTPIRLLNTARFAVYEQTLEFQVPAAGRYLLRIEGAAPASTRPKNLPTTPAAREVAELYPRLVVRTLTPGGPVLLENATPKRPALPMPADALRAVGLGDR